MALLECVPNISLSAPEDVRRVACAVQNTPGATLLHTDSNPAANRTVLTFAGTAEAVFQAARACLKTTLELADMRLHRGAHPRLGALDVCPFVPVSGITLQEAARLAVRFGQLAAQEFNVPVYLYEAAARRAQTRNLADVRRGEYESLPQKLQTLPPDFGPRVFNAGVAKTGASVIGARPFLIAFNINLNTQDPAPAKKIAAVLREKNGGLKAVKAIGWYMENFRRAQISCNLTDFTQTGPAQVFAAAQKEAQKLGFMATGCELVGLIPLQALLAAGRFYAPGQTDETALIRAAANGLSLSDVKPFNPHEQILEYRLKALTAR